MSAPLHSRIPSHPTTVHRPYHTNSEIPGIAGAAKQDVRAPNKLTIVPADKRVAVAAPPCAVNVLGAVLERNVHVSVDGLEGAFGGLSVSWWLEWRGTMGAVAI